MNLEETAVSYAKLQYGVPTSFNSKLEFDAFETTVDDFKAGFETGWLDHQLELVENIKKQVVFASDRWVNSKTVEEGEFWKAYKSRFDFVIKAIENPFLLKHLPEEVIAAKLSRDNAQLNILPNNYSLDHK